VRTHPEVVDEKRLERGVDRHDPLAATLRPPHLHEPPLEVDVLPIEAEQLAASQPGIGEEREQEPVALALTVMLALPDVVALGRVEQPYQLAAVEHVAERLALLRRPQDERRVALDLLVLEQEAEEALERGDGARLARRCRPPHRLLREEATQMR